MLKSLAKGQLQELSNDLNGELFFDELHRNIYATDASVYRKKPLAVAIPKTKEDLKILILFANKHQLGLIPRAAGTSLAGQCVGEGIVVDTSKYFDQILSFDKAKKTITVAPGIIRDELNVFLAPYGLFFGPNTSTSNRCMLGGMVGNNSSGTTSIRYGVTRDKVLALETLLSDGSEVTFKALSKDEFHQKLLGNTLEAKIYQKIYNELSQKEVQIEIQKEFPKSTIHRRNTGYALDALLETSVFSKSQNKVNLAKLLCGSEGTLALTTAITLQLDALPPKEQITVAVHFKSIEQSLQAVLVAMKHHLFACELLDKTILDCTKNNRSQVKNRFFIEGDPEAVLLLELKANSMQDVEKQAIDLIQDLKKHHFGYAYPMLYGEQSLQAAALRSAGLGLLGNITGDKKAVACIEDTAVDLTDLPAYIAEFSDLMKKHQQKAVYYAHAGAGELHLRPILNLKKSEDVQLFKTITLETAQLVKKYKGSFSGEHGDGIVRGAFIPLMVGQKNYKLMKEIKYTFDPQNIFNRGKKIDAYPMDESLRYQIDRKEPEISTLLDFSDSQGLLRATEKCNGSGDCRKLSNAGGTMCPSFRATLNEKDSTRARANALREFLSQEGAQNKFDHNELKEVFDLCISCKACASECPSNVDVASFKAEFLYQYQELNGYGFRNKLFANNASYNRIASKMPKLSNLLLNTTLLKMVMGIAKQRSIPKLNTITFTNWYKKNQHLFKEPLVPKKEIYLFIDEFTNYYDLQIGIDCIELLNHLGYTVHISAQNESGRSQISKGFLKEAKNIANINIDHFKDIISKDKPLVGIEPSAILTFRDEYLRLAKDKKEAQQIADHTYTIEEFIKNEIDVGHISAGQFTDEASQIKIHGHCHQKALSSMAPTFAMLNLPKNYSVTLINSGCCGMAGSFGYEKQHYQISMQIGEQSLFSKIRKYQASTQICAAGTSCRHQIYDGTTRMAKHPVSILKEALL